MEEPSNAITETRKELMISPTGEGSPTLRTAHFLKPSVTSIKGPIFDLPSHSLSSLPPIFDPKNWPVSVTFNGWRSPGEKWMSWLDKMASLHESTWKKAGIYEAILSTKYEIPRNNDLVFGVVERWCPETKSFIFPWGEATITLEDVMISGYSVLGSSVFSPLETEELKGIDEKLNNARLEMTRSSSKKANGQLWMKKFMDSGSEVEHEACLAFWLSRYIFANSRDSISKLVFPIAIHLAKGTKIALAPAILASIYRNMTLLKGKIFESTMLGTKQDSDGVLTLMLGSPFQLVQVWAWERFTELQPKPNLINNGEPRLARWDKLKHNVENVRLVLESAKQSFNWRPYAQTVKNWDFPKFYRENEMCVLVDSSFDEELMSFAQCLRVSALVGFDCIEQYLPHRVAMQFGIDQDLPGCVGQFAENPAIAWGDYSSPIGNAKLFIPSRLFESSVTTRYMKWWKQSMLGLQGAREGVVQWQKHLMDFRRASKSSKEKKASYSSKRFKKTAKSCKGTKKDSVSISSFRISPKVSNRTTEDNIFFSRFKIKPKCSKETREGDGSSTSSSFPLKSSEISPKLPKRKNKCNDASIALGNSLKRSKVSAKSSKGKKECNHVSASPGFSLKSSKESPRSSKRMKGGKDATLCNDSALKVSKKSVLGSKGKNKGIYNEFTAEKSTPSLKRKNEENDESASPACPSKLAKTLSLKSIAMREMNNALVPPGFPLRCNMVEVRDTIEEDNLTIAEMLKSCGKHDVENRDNGDSDNSSGHSRSVPSSTADNGAAKIEEPLAAPVVKVAENEAVEVKQGDDGENSLGQSQNHFSSVVYNKVLKESMTAITEKVRQVEALENRQGGDGENLPGQYESHASSIANNVGLNNLEPLMTSVERIQCSEVVMRGSERAVEDANQSNAGTPAHRMQSPIDSRVSRSDACKIQWLEDRIKSLEKMAAEKKEAIWAKIAT